MLILETTDTLQIKLGEAISTSNCDVSVSYRDITATTFAHSRMLTNSNGVTDANILSAPAASHQYMVDTISIHNADTIQHFVTIKYDVSGTEKIVYKGAVIAGGLLHYNDATGWKKVPDGNTGDAFVYSDFTPEQLIALKGEAGLSAYQIAVLHGYTGTEEEWINSLSFTTWSAAMFTTGIKTTGVDGGLLNQQSITDDYLYHCVQGGDSTEAIWKKTLLFQTI